MLQHLPTPLLLARPKLLLALQLQSALIFLRLTALTRVQNRQVLQVLFCFAQCSDLTIYVRS